MWPLRSKSPLPDVSEDVRMRAGPQEERQEAEADFLLLGSPLLLKERPLHQERSTFGG